MSSQQPRPTSFLHSIIDAIADPTLVTDCEYCIVLANRAAREQAGGADPAAAGWKCHQLLHHSETPCEGEALVCPLREAIATKAPAKATHLHPSVTGTGHAAFECLASPVLDENGEVDYVVHSARDVSERELSRKAQEFTRRLLEIANRHVEMHPLLREFVAEVKRFTCCAAVGIRVLGEDGSIPYQAYDGFSKGFFERESPLVVGSDQCMCIRVIQGETDPGLPFYTPGGSFHMNGTTRFLATVSEEEKGSTRNECNRVGYESVALVPIRSGPAILGLIHVADPHESMVPLEVVETLEQGAMKLGMAMERVRAQEALRQSQARYALAEEVGHFGHWDRDFSQHAIGWSRGTYRIFGVDPEQFYPSYDAFLGLVHPADREGLRCAVDAALSRGDRLDCDYRVIRPDGAERVIHSVAEVRCDRSGVPVRLVGTVRDITERNRAEREMRNLNEELERRVAERTRELSTANEQLTAELARRRQAERTLRESEEKYRSLFAAESDAVLLFDAETRRFVDVNDAALCLYGYTRQEFLELTHWDITAEPEASASAIAQVIDERIIRIPLRYHRRKDGTRFPVEIAGSTFRWLGRMAVCGVVRDITERKQARDQLLAYQAELRSLASQLALAEERTRRRLAASLHDNVGQSLAAVKLQLELLRKADLPEPQRQALGRARELLDGTVRESWSLMRELSPPFLYEVGLGAALGWLVEQFCDQHGLLLEFEDDGQPKPLPEHIRGVVFHAARELLTNVVKHARASHSKLIFRRGGDEARLSVEDDGVGFDPSRLGSPQNSAGGFGLFNIREQVAMIGGRLELDAEPGRGTRVAVVVALDTRERGTRKNG